MVGEGLVSFFRQPAFTLIAAYISLNRVYVSLLKNSPPDCFYLAALGTVAFESTFSCLVCIMKQGTSDDVPCFMVGEGGFEPPKHDATDLQSAPFGHSGILPYSVKLMELVDGLEPPTC